MKTLSNYTLLRGKHLYFGFLISVLSATIVGMISIPVYFLGFQTDLICEGRSKESVPAKLQWVKTISEILFVYFLYYWYFLNILFYFRPLQISGLKLKLVLLCLPMYLLDSAYRIALQVFDGNLALKLTPTQRIPAIILSLHNCLQVYITVRHFCQMPRIKQLKLMLVSSLRFSNCCGSSGSFFYISSLQQSRH